MNDPHEIENQQEQDLSGENSDKQDRAAELSARIAGVKSKLEALKGAVERPTSATEKLDARNMPELNVRPAELNAKIERVKAKIEALRETSQLPHLVANPLGATKDDTPTAATTPSATNLLTRVVVALLGFVIVWQVSLMSHLHTWLGGSLFAAVVVLFPRAFDERSYKFSQNISPQIALCLKGALGIILVIIVNQLVDTLKIPQ